MPKITPVILAGGSGTRLWPLSTDARPKQFQPVAGDDSLLRQTVLRVADAARFNAPVIIGNATQADLIAQALAGLPVAATVLEPAGRNTAPAIALAALLARRNGLGEFLLVLPSDHVITRPEALEAAIDIAAGAAAAGALVTFGIAPSGPATSYGYIRQGAALAAAPGAFAVDRFVEKPDRARAQAMLAEGGYAWNSGMFLFPVETLLAEFARLEPALLDTCRSALEDATTQGVALTPGRAAFLAATSISIDYAIMEHTARAAVVPVDPGWSDVGAWDAVWQIAGKDAAGNVTGGDVLLRDVTGSYVRSLGPTTAVIGLDNVVVVNTGDAVIVMPLERAQDVKHIAEALRSRKDRGVA
jgi:mannose-1-phosphate guanylyltransferase/mannose-6-phosphate isomerase